MKNFLIKTKNKQHIDKQITVNFDIMVVADPENSKGK